jgi:hypothetical protein
MRCLAWIRLESKGTYLQATYLERDTENIPHQHHRIIIIILEIHINTA